jgi:hypothetical protein
LPRRTRKPLVDVKLGNAWAAYNRRRLAVLREELRREWQQQQQAKNVRRS